MGGGGLQAQDWGSGHFLHHCVCCPCVSKQVHPVVCSVPILLSAVHNMVSIGHGSPLYYHTGCQQAMVYHFPLEKSPILCSLAFSISLIPSTRFPCLSSIPAFEFKMGTASNVMWLTIVYICMLATNNICLQYVEVSFFQVTITAPRIVSDPLWYLTSFNTLQIARSLTVAFQVLLTRVILNESTSGQALVGCGVVIIGFLLGSEGEVHFSWIGSFFGVLSSLFVALHGIKVKSVLDVMNKDEWKLILYNTQLSVVLLLPILWASGEISDVLLYLEDLGAESKIPAATEGDLSTSHFWFLMVLASILGFLINVSVFLLIKNTSPLTSVIVGAVKVSAPSLLACLWRELDAMSF